jgi:hypothetical protein
VSARRLPLAAFAAATLIAAGCGNDRGEPPDLDRLGAARPTTEFERAGAVSFRHPRSWSAREGEPPQYASLASGGALAAIYGYPRSDLGLDPASIEASRQRLIASLREREPGFLLERTEVTEVDGSPAVEIRGRGAVGGRPVETRSIHVYKPEVEWVIDAYAQPAKFDRANRIAFGPLLASVELSDAVPELGNGGTEG